MAVMVDEFHNRAEGQRVGEAILSLSMEDLYQLVVASFPESVNTSALNQMVTFCPSGCRSSCSCLETLLTTVQPFTGHFLYCAQVCSLSSDHTDIYKFLSAYILNEDILSGGHLFGLFYF